MHRLDIKNVALIAILAALSAVLMLFSIPLPFAPSFLKFDIAELPALFAGFFIGPAGGVLVVILKILIKLITQGTDTAFIGEAINIVGSICFVLPASLIYRKLHTKRGAIAAMVVSSVFVSVIFIFLNAYVAFPMFSKLYGMLMEAIIAMGTAVIPAIHDTTTLMLYSVFPFNLLKHLVTSFLTWLLYKRTAVVIRKLFRMEA